jgi:hypothetical protein
MTDMKIYLGRSNTYLNVVNSLSILFLATEKVKDYDVHLTIYHQIGIALLLFGVLIFIGWIDVSKGLYILETKKCANNNPQQMETLEIVKRIEEKINGIN